MKQYYYVANGGDGSAHAAFFTDKKCAEVAEELEQNLFGEGWAEPSVDKVPKPTTREEYIKQLKEDLKDYEDDERVKHIQAAIDKLSK